MFPNQNREAWGSSVQGYYGSGYSSSSSWYNNWSGQAGPRSSSSWGYNNQPQGVDGEGSGGQNFSKSAKLGINSNIYSIYQNRNQAQISPHDTPAQQSQPQHHMSAAKQQRHPEMMIPEHEQTGGHEATTVEDLFTSCMQEQSTLHQSSKMAEERSKSVDGHIDRRLEGGGLHDRRLDESHIDQRLEEGGLLDRRLEEGGHIDRRLDGGTHLDRRLDGDDILDRRLDVHVDRRHEAALHLDRRLEAGGQIDHLEDKIDHTRKYEQPELTIDEGAMEPDSSTDNLPESDTSPVTSSRSPRDTRFAQEHESPELSAHNGNHPPPPPLHHQGIKNYSSPFHNNGKSFPAAQLFKVKSETPFNGGGGINFSNKNQNCDVEAKKRKLEAALLEITARERNAVLRDEAAGGGGGGALPLSVQINEGVRGADRVASDQDSPQEKFADPLSILTRPDAFLTSTLNHRKRGRKPKHYSEILHELGQRGISITKTQRSCNSPPPLISAPGHPGPLPHHQQGGPPPHGNQPLGFNPADHKTGNQQLQCPHCNKILTTSVGLMYHIRLHTGEKPYNCNLCGKSFATSSHYHYHIRTHSGEKPYRCDFCGKMYTASGSLRLHLKSHLSRLSANVLSLGMNMESMNMFRGLEAIMGNERGGPGEGPQHQEAKFIKQEVLSDDGPVSRLAAENS